MDDDWWLDQESCKRHWYTKPSFRLPFHMNLTPLILRSEESVMRELGLLPEVVRKGADKDVVRAKVDMVDLYLRLFQTAPPRRAGSRYVQVRCFGHEDRNASMSLDNQWKRYNCFSCGERGDCFKLYQQVNNCLFFQAVNDLDAWY